MNQFKGKLYKNDSADPVLVDAMVDGANILLESDHGKDYLPIAEISIKEGGDLGDRVRVTHAASRSVVIFNGHSFLEELETRHPELDHIKASRAIKHKVKHSNLIRGSHVAIIIGVVLGICLLAYLSLDFWVAMAADKVPVSVEEAIGEMALPKKLLSDRKKSKMVAKVEDIGNKLVGSLGKTPYKFHFYVEDKKVLNAYSLPGGNVVLLSRLIKEAKTDDEIAGVFAHEIGHVVHRDSLKRVLHTSGLGMCLAIITGGTVNNKQLAVLIPTMQELERLNFSRVQEAAADKLAVELTLKSGYDPEALIELFMRLQKEEEGIPRAAMVLISDHPMAEDRIKAIRADANKMRKELGIPEPAPAVPAPVPNSVPSK